MIAQNELNKVAYYVDSSLQLKSNQTPKPEKTA